MFLFIPLMFNHHLYNTDLSQNKLLNRLNQLQSMS